MGEKIKTKQSHIVKIDRYRQKSHELLVEMVNKIHGTFDLKRVIMFDSFDLASYLETSEGKIDLVSFQPLF